MQADEAMLLHTNSSSDINEHEDSSILKNDPTFFPREVISEEVHLREKEFKKDKELIDINQESKEEDEQYHTAFFESANKSIRRFSGDISEEEADENIAYRSSPDKLRQSLNN